MSKNNAIKESCIRVNYSCWLFSVQAGSDLWHVLQYHLLFFFIAEIWIFLQARWYHSWHLLHSIYFLPSSGIRQLQNTFTSYTTIFSFWGSSLWQSRKGLMAVSLLITHFTLSQVYRGSKALYNHDNGCIHNPHIVQTIKLKRNG